MIKLRVFVSSPGDVREERRLAGRVLERLGVKWGQRAQIEPVLWENEPLGAAADYQAQIPPVEDSDLAVVIFWARFGSPLGPEHARADGSRYGSGTEYEIERALEAQAASGRPELLVYHKTKRATAALDSREALEESWRQKQALDALVERVFTNPDGTAARARHSFEEPEQFEALLWEHLDRLIVRRLEREGEAAAGEAACRTGEPGFPTVFICHASEDADRAREVYEALARAGLQPWLDKEALRGGERWDERIEAMIEKVDYFVVLNSRFLVAKRRKVSYVNKEIKRALKADELHPPGSSFIIPVSLDDAPLLDDLARFQAVDLRSSDGLRALVQGIKRQVSAA